MPRLLAWSLITATVLFAGCAPRARLRDNPFAEPNKNRKSASDAIELRRNRDPSQEISGSPVTDTNRTPAGLARREARGPNSTGVEFSGASSPDRPAVSNAAASQLTYEEISQRLRNLGARNIKVGAENDPGKFFFRCEVPNPNDPNRLRVFETSEPAASELDAMLAVADAIEAWLNQTRGEKPGVR